MNNRIITTTTHKYQPVRSGGKKSKIVKTSDLKQFDQKKDEDNPKPRKPQGPLITQRNMEEYRKKPEETKRTGKKKS